MRQNEKTLHRNQGRRRQIRKREQFTRLGTWCRNDI
jgi:hypothetical protein